MPNNLDLTKKCVPFETRVSIAVEVAKVVNQNPLSVEGFLETVQQSFDALGPVLDKCRESFRNVEDPKQTSTDLTL